MLRKSHRIRSRDFVTIAKGGTVSSSPLFFVRALIIEPNIKNTLQNKAFSVVVSKKVAKTAVKRNLIRRKIYSILGDFLKKTEKPENLSIKAVVSVKKDISRLNLNLLTEEVNVVLKRFFS